MTLLMDEEDYRNEAADLRRESCIYGGLSAMFFLGAAAGAYSGYSLVAGAVASLSFVAVNKSIASLGNSRALSNAVKSMQERYIHIDENEYEQFYNLPHSKHKPVEQVCADYDAWMAQYNGGEAPQDEVPRVSGPF